METRILCDCHIHSEHSHDSRSKISEVAEQCIKRRISIFALTDHCDILHPDKEKVKMSVKAMLDDVTENAKRYMGQVEILRGIEVGEAMWDRALAEEILGSYDFDVVIGSVHSVRYKEYSMPYSRIDFSGFSRENINGYIDKYFDEVMEMLELKNCDIMAHLTCPLRYINGKYNLNIGIRKYKQKIEGILKFVIDNHIAMEVNTSGVSAGLKSFMPDEWIIEKFKTMGGELVTLGSDAHIPQNVGIDFDKATAVLRKYGFEKYCIYRKRKAVFVEL